MNEKFEQLDKSIDEKADNAEIMFSLANVNKNIQSNLEVTSKMRDCKFDKNEL